MQTKYLIYSILICFLFSCQKVQINKDFIKIATAPGPEDIVFDKINNRILVSCNERRDGKTAYSEIQQINLSTNVSTILPFINMPAIEFKPVGIDLQTINDIQYLYVVNYTQPRSVIQFKVNKENLDFIKEYKNDLLITPNDLTVLPNGSFYFSNDKDSPNIIELLTNPNGGSVGYCDGNNTWKKVDSAVGFPNGLYNENDTLYVATSRHKALYKYEIQSNGNLLNRRILSNINGFDNISSYGEELIIAVHPDEIKFALLSFIPSALSPCKTYSINKYTGASKLIFEDEGKLISGSSTALIIGNDLYLSQIFGEYVLKITNYKH